MYKGSHCAEHLTSVPLKTSVFIIPQLLPPSSTLVNREDSHLWCDFADGERLRHTFAEESKLVSGEVQLPFSS